MHPGPYKAFSLKPSKSPPAPTSTLFPTWPFLSPFPSISFFRSPFRSPSLLFQVFFLLSHLTFLNGL